MIFDWMITCNCVLYANKQNEIRCLSSKKWNECCFRPPLCTLVRLNWANQSSGHDWCMLTGVPVFHPIWWTSKTQIYVNKDQCEKGSGYEALRLHSSPHVSWCCHGERILIGSSCTGITITTGKCRNENIWNFYQL
jgi:hypothetical protein